MYEAVIGVPTRPSRLTTMYYKREAENINQMLELFKLYVKELHKEKPNKILLEGVRAAPFCLPVNNFSYSPLFPLV